mgnify:CR=1 FL=1
MRPLCLLFFALMATAHLLANTCPAMANSDITVDVEVINALRTSSEVDPQLTGLAREVGPVLNFTGFKLLKKSQVPLKTGEEKEVFLSGNRRLTLKLKGFETGQARLELRIFRDRTEIFSTTLLLIDRGGAIIGGPKLNKGVMLIRVQGKFG